MSANALATALLSSVTQTTRKTCINCGVRFTPLKSYYLVCQDCFYSDDCPVCGSELQEHGMGCGCFEDLHWEND